MNAANITTAIGLGLDIAGAILLWFYIEPSPWKETPNHKAWMITAATTAEASAKAKKYRVFSKIGLALLIIGFIFQLIGTLAGGENAK